MRRILWVALCLAMGMVVVGCSGGGGTPTPAADGSPSASSPAADAPNGDLATELNGSWTSSLGQTLAWELAGDKGTVAYAESFDGVDPSEAKEFNVNVDVAANGADFEFGDGANLMRVRYLGVNMLIAERVSTESRTILSCDIYSRTKEAAVQAATAFSAALPGTNGSVATKDGEKSYYGKLVDEGLLVLEANVIAASE